MPQKIIAIGTHPADGSGDPIRVSFDKINQNFTELYSAITVDTYSAVELDQLLLNITTASQSAGFKPVPQTPIGRDGDVLGDTAIDDVHLYYCTATHDGLAEIWRRQLLTGSPW